MIVYAKKQYFSRSSAREDAPKASTPAWLELSFAAAAAFIAIMGLVDVLFVVLFIAAMLGW